MKAHTRSLAESEPDEFVVVRRILFECLQDHCSHLGVRQGDRLSVVRRGPSTFGLRTADGTVVPCPEEFAHFVEIGAVEIERGPRPT
jgi:hypothetical protein